MAGERFQRDALLEALDRIGAAAVTYGAALTFAVYGGSALVLGSNFRFGSEDVDIAEIGMAWPDWLRAVVADIARRNGWSPDWLNDAVTVHLSAAATAADHFEFGSFPRQGDQVGLRVILPAADYLLALKLKAMRLNDPTKGPVERADIQNLIAVAGLTGVEDAIALLGRYFPKSARDADKQRFLLKYVWPSSLEGSAQRDDPPQYPVRRD
jgi:hypothetical protein